MSRAKFKRELIKKLAEIGYEKYPSTAGPHFVKYVGEGFYNVLFITFSRYDKGGFTGDFFLSLYPSSLYEEGWKKKVKYRERFSCYLNMDERKRLLNPLRNNIDKVVYDGWWYQEDENVIAHFVEAVSCAEPRFLSTDNIYQQVLDNVRLRWHYQKEITEIIKLAYSDEIHGKEYQFLPKTDPDKMGENWFKAAELFIKEKQQRDRGYVFSLTKDSVKNIASESYMVDKYEKLYGAYNPILLDLNCEKFSDLLSL